LNTWLSLVVVVVVIQGVVVVEQVVSAQEHPYP
jgi:hypothetical protein